MGDAFRAFCLSAGAMLATFGAQEKPLPPAPGNVTAHAAKRARRLEANNGAGLSVAEKRIAAVRNRQLRRKARTLLPASGVSQSLN
jgi:hypothetical protein